MQLVKWSQNANSSWPIQVCPGIELPPWHLQMRLSVASLYADHTNWHQCRCLYVHLRVTSTKDPSRYFCRSSEAMFHRLQTVSLVLRKTHRYPQLLWYQCPVDFCIPPLFSQTDAYLHSVLQYCSLLTLTFSPAVSRWKAFASSWVTEGDLLFFYAFFYNSLK